MLRIQPHHRVFFMQFAMAFALGALLSRLPDLQVRFGLTESRLGLLLLTLSLGVLGGMTVAARLIERVGARVTALVTVLGATSLYALVPWMPSALAAAPLLVLSGLLMGAFEINTNLEADRHEARLGRRIMSRTHGMWSLDFFVTALLGAALRQASVPVQAHMALVLVVVLASGWVVLSKVEGAPRRADVPSGHGPRLAWPTLGLLPLCLVAAAPLLAEGASVDWSTIYMRDVFATSPFVGGLSVTVFSLAIALGRLGMDPVVDRFAPRPVAVALLAMAALGLVLVAAAPYPVVALMGFALTGLGCSAVYPLAISAAARRTDRAAAANVAALGQMTFVVFFLGPPLLGFIAQHAGVRASYGTVVPVLVAALLATNALARDARQA